MIAPVSATAIALLEPITRFEAMSVVQCGLCVLGTLPAAIASRNLPGVTP
jgi:hypothetical protein